MLAKRIFALLTALLILSAGFTAVDARKTIEEYFAEMVIPDITEASVTTPRMAVYDLESGACLYGKGNADLTAPASLTKLVTAMVVLKNLPVYETVTVGSELDLVEYDSSRCGIKEGQTYSVYGLLYGLLMRSGNDAAYTLAVNTARAVCETKLNDREAAEYFCGMMNDLCRDIGAANSNFATPDGYDATGQLTTLDDLAIIAKKALEYEIIAEITSCPLIEVYTTENEKNVWRNTNFFLNTAFPLYNPNVRGMKTGSTDDAGKCLITLFTSGGREFIAIVSGCTTEGERYASASYLMAQVDVLSGMAEVVPVLLGAAG